MEESMVDTAPGDRSRVPLPVSTLLTPDERLRVDAAGMGIYQAIHRHSIEEIARDLHSNRVTAMVLSANCCEQQALPKIARMVREFPRVPVVAVVSQFNSNASQAVLLLGRCGIRTLIDIRHAQGWKELRSLLAHDRRKEGQRTAAVQLETDLSGAPSGCLIFFRVLFETAHHTTTVRMLSETMHVVPSTLMSRFYRVGLPAPKQYLALARLTCAAYLFENRGLSVAGVANQLDYSSPQSFGRHVRLQLKLPALEFRERYDGDGMLQHFRAALVLPYLDVLRVFDPLSNAS
jgi:AraC-like DNA-binding protein